jgi:hypothetical protein
MRVDKHPVISKLNKRRIMLTNMDLIFGCFMLVYSWFGNIVISSADAERICVHDRKKYYGYRL